MSVTRPDHLIWERILIPDGGAISPAAAAYLRDLTLTQADRDRVTELGSKAETATLTPDERNELDEYILVGHQLARIQSLARVALRNMTPVANTHV